MLRRLILLVLALAALPAGATAAPASTAAPPSLRQLAKHIVAVGAPGAVVAIRDANGVRAGTAGYANLRAKEPLGAEHEFRVGSITKTFVAAVVLQLSADGMLGLDDRVERWLPGLVPNGAAISLRQLLNHTSGIYNYTDDPVLIRSFLRNRLTVWTPAALVGLATAHRPLFAPGSSWAYSNTGYILLGLVIEQATGTTLEEQLRRRIFEPLALTRTSFPSVPTLTAPFARGYVLRGNGLVPTPGGRPADVTVWSPSWAWAAGAVVSTAGDLARFYAGVLGGGVLAPAQLRELKTTVLAEGGPAGYGLGVISTPLRCGTAWGHSGSVPGYTTLVLSREDGSRQAVVLVNASIETARQVIPFADAGGSAFCR